MDMAKEWEGWGHRIWRFEQRRMSATSRTGTMAEQCQRCSTKIVDEERVCDQSCRINQWQEDRDMVIDSD